ncbi:MAG: hypothetical protein ACFFB5_13770 [Promethearchaeota archaeon]
MIVVECDLDFYFVQSLEIPATSIRHESGKGRVINSLRKGFGTLGMVDEDPTSTQPKDLRNYVQIDNNEDLRLMRRQDSENIKLIIIPNYIEAWILSRSQKHNVDITTYGLPTDPVQLHDIPHVERIQNFKQFLHRLQAIDPIFDVLKEWLLQGL